MSSRRAGARRVARGMLGSGGGAAALLLAVVGRAQGAPPYAQQQYPQQQAQPPYPAQPQYAGQPQYPAQPQYPGQQPGYGAPGQSYPPPPNGPQPYPQQAQPYPQQAQPYPQQAQPYPQQAQPYPGQSYSGTPPAQGAAAAGSWSMGTPGFGGVGQRPSSMSERASRLERTFLYGTSIAYGVGMGVWLDTELGVSDPGVAFIPPLVLGVAAPVGVFVLDDPPMRAGLPAATAAGLAIGAGEGLGIASTHFVTVRRSDEWGLRGFARASALGATLGGAAGYLAGRYAEPEPLVSAFAFSGTLWGTAIGSMFGYGLSPAKVGYGASNDSAAVAGLVGYNLGLGAALGLSAVHVPSAFELGWMWAGAGIGAAVSLPVFLAYAGSDTPPAKRGFIFMGTATTLGLVAAGVLSSRASSSRSSAGGGGFARSDRAETAPLAQGEAPRAWQIEGVTPMLRADGGGLLVIGSLR